MPLISLSGPEAIRLRKSSTVSTWGLRTAENRVEPVAKPAFKVPFQLVPGEKIFTIGSCFARHVEGELLERGFQVPIRDLFKTREFDGLSPEIVNNFGTPSIFNELSWAFGEEPFDEAANFVEVGNGKYVDLHIINSIKPAPLELVRARRRGVMEATRTLAQCRVLIITLGLVELWWDGATESYLNTAPMPSVLKKYPKRFSLHVLSFDECLDYIDRAVKIAFARGRPDLQIILTVSPVPMAATHRNDDVIIANSYSKSVLRAVAEHLVLTNNAITYFPSYETVTISDRRLSWSDDLVHVRREMVAFNIDRMVNAFTGKGDTSELVLENTDDAPAESAAALLLAERARVARTRSDHVFFEQHKQSARTSFAFAREYAKFLKENKNYEEALEIIGDHQSTEITVLRAEIMLAMNKLDIAEEAIRPLCHAGVPGQTHWQILLKIAEARKSVQEILDVEEAWLSCQPRRRSQILFLTGRALRLLHKNKAALERLVEVAADPDRSDLAAIECATAMFDARKFEEAARVLQDVGGQTDWQVRQISRLNRKIESRLRGMAGQNPVDAET